jgi:hypothetical protein
MGRKLFNFKNIAMVAVFSLIAFVGFSAFKNADIKPVQQPALYWYSISSSNTLASQLNSTPQTKNESLPTGGNPLTECEDTSSDFCIVGYTTPQSVGTPVSCRSQNCQRLAVFLQHPGITWCPDALVF